MKSRTILISAVLHVAIFGAALTVSKSRAARRATQVAVIGEKKKNKPEEKREKPKPKPLLASARPEAARATTQSTKPTPSRVEAPTSAPIETNLHMGNDDGPGIALGPPVGKAPPPE